MQIQHGLGVIVTFPVGCKSTVYLFVLIQYRKSGSSLISIILPDPDLHPELPIWIRHGDIKIRILFANSYFKVVQFALDNILISLENLIYALKVLKQSCIVRLIFPVLPWTSFWVGRGSGSGSGSRPASKWNVGSGSRSVSTGCRSRYWSYNVMLCYRLRTPRQPHLLLLYSSPEVKTYRFHSGLGGDIMVMELMAEPRLAFTFPQQLL